MRGDVLIVLIGLIVTLLMLAPRTAAAEPGWTDADGFHLSSDTGDYTLHFGFSAGYKFEPALVDTTWQNRQAFAELRPSLSGNLYKPWIHFTTSLELAANPPYLLDAFVDIDRYRAAQLQFGQFRTPYSRHQNYSMVDLLFVDHAVTSNYFWTGRDKGSVVKGELGDRTVDYWVGLFSGTPLRQFTAISGNYQFHARATIHPMGLLAANEYPYIVAKGKVGPPFAVSGTLEGYYGKIQEADENFDPNSFGFSVTPSGQITRSGGLGADVFLQSSCVVAFAEAFYRHTNPEGGAAYQSWGIWGQAGYLLVPSTLDVALRVNFVNPSINLSDDTFESIEAQLAWYIDPPRLAIKLRYGLGEQHSPGTAALGDVALAVSAVGTINVFTVQFNLSY